ncbi:MAG: hypothetical protein IKO40_00390 [Kiritimatiellae bacterium]|nr:hypothetical protein [Kiritimatiellia bacterium]
MNTSLIKSALAMTAAFAVGSALATEEVTKLYGATFEDAADGINNDYAYTAGELVSIYSGANLSKWFAGSAEDQSTITDVDAKTGDQALKLQTEGGTLTNQFFDTTLSGINDARTNAMVRFEANVRFVASDTLECGVEADGDAKFALYAYAPDGGPTNLVIFHRDTANLPVNNVISNIVIDTGDYSAVVVEYRTTTDGESFFTVAVNGTTAESDETFPLDDDGYWFKTINGATAAQAQITSLCFKGTGMVDDIAISKVEEAQQSGWVDDSTTVSNQTAAAAYPALTSSALANANAGELTDWATANSIAFADVAADTTGTLVDAFLLNCTAAEVAEEKEEFVLNITIDENGNPVITLPAGFDYNGTLQLKGSADLSSWHDCANNQPGAGDRFFKYLLSL